MVNGKAVLPTAPLGVPQSARQPLRYQPPHRQGSPVVFLLEAPTRLKRLAFRQRWQQLAGRIVERPEVEAAFVKAVRTWVEGEAEAEQFLALYERHRALEAPLAEATLALARARRGQSVAAGEGEEAAAAEAIAAAERQLQELTPPAEEAEAMRRLTDSLLDVDETYRDLRARHETGWQLAMLAAVETYLVGWEGIELPFRREQGRAAEACLEVLTDLDVTLIGTEMLKLQRLSQSAEKNSASPSPSLASQAPTGSA